MDRSKVYPGQQVIDTDLLNAQKAAYVAMSELFRATMGEATVVDGFAPVPGTGLQVSVGPGSIYTLQATDTAAYGSLASDARTTVKQGLSRDPVLLNTPAPGSADQSINYLVQIGFQEVDGGATILPFYNSGAPTVPWAGPNNDNSASFTLRLDQALVAIKAGAAAVTGLQVTPAPDAGYVAAYEIQVPNGASGVLATNIRRVFGAPLIRAKVPDISRKFAPIAYQAFGY